MNKFFPLVKPHINYSLININNIFMMFQTYEYGLSSNPQPQFYKQGRHATIFS